MSKSDQHVLTWYALKKFLSTRPKLTYWFWRSFLHMAPTGQGQCARLLNRPGSIDSGNKILIVFGYNLTKMLRFMLINKHFYRYWRNHQPLNQGTSWQFDQYRLAIWPIPVGVLVNTGWWIGQYRLANWSIPVGELANTGWRFQNVGDGTFWTSLPLPYEDIYFQSCLANYLSVEGSISFWKKAYLDVHMYLNGQKGS